MANAELLERELTKLDSMSTALADTLRRRGVAEPAASLTAGAGVAVFKIGFERWIMPAEERDMSQVMRESLDELKAVTAGGQVPHGLRLRQSQRPSGDRQGDEEAWLVRPARCSWASLSSALPHHDRRRAARRRTASHGEAAPPPSRQPVNRAGAGTTMQVLLGQAAIGHAVSGRISGRRTTSPMRCQS